jgi:K+-sensing histidine kinase KdpD
MESSSSSDDASVFETSQLKRGATTEQDVLIFEPQVDYKPVPRKRVDEDIPVWRVRFDLATDPSRAFGLDINGEVVLGRGPTSATDIDLSEFDAAKLGVSREHLKLRPTGTRLFVIDLESTNGTYRNGHPVGVKNPEGLNHGDTLSLGRLQFTVRIIERPTGHTAKLIQKADLAEALIQTAKAITSQLELAEVLNQVAEAAVGLISAGEVGVWLRDRESGELFLEAEGGIEDERVKRMRLPVTKDSLAGQVLESGKPVRASREPGGDQIKVKTGYLVESLLYVPLTIGGEAIGVLMAAHREEGKKFSEEDEKLLVSVADLAAIAVQNSRAYQLTNEALARRVDELATLNELSHAVSATLDLDKVHDVLIEHIGRHWEVKAARLWLVDQTTKTVSSFDALYGRDDDGPGAHFEVGKGIVGGVAKSGKPIMVSNVKNHKSYDADIDTAAGVTAKNMACVPLFVADQVVGVLGLFNKQKGNFREHDLERLQAFASPVATAIENARLFARSERERATVQATANSLSQPLMILSDEGAVIISNEPANKLLDTHMAQVFDGLSEGVGQTTEIAVGDETYITTTQHSPGVGTIVIMQDITYVKKLERARTEFIQALSHDLKSPLTSIKGWTDLLNAYGQLSDQATKFVGQIRSAADRVLEMVGQLLTVALLSDTARKREEVCDLAEIVANVVGDLEGAALAKSIKLESKQIGQPYKIQGDCTHLYRSVLNLVDNAIKYPARDTTVAIALTYWGETVTVQVRDQGPGIPEEDLPHIFERYYRGQQVQETESGVGLGLAMVRATARAHGGEATARNLPDGGAEFTITLPAKPVEEDE